MPYYPPPSSGGSTSFADPTALIGLDPVNGVATTAMRSDAAPALDPVLEIRTKLSADTTYSVRTAPETVTVSIASPGVVGWTNHGIAPNDAVVFAPVWSAPAACTITIASPGVITLTGHNLVADQRFRLATNGALPTEFYEDCIYNVKTVLGANTFTAYQASLSTSVINDSGSQSGSHTIRYIDRLPTPLVHGTIYYAKTILDANSLTLSLTPGGAAINTSGSQVGAHAAQTGSDTNDGSAATRAAALLTGQRAADIISAEIDFNGYNVALQLSDGVYDGLLFGPLVSSAGQRGVRANAVLGELTIQGSATDELAVIVRESVVSPGIHIQIAPTPVQVWFRDFTCDTTADTEDHACLAIFGPAQVGFNDRSGGVLRFIGDPANGGDPFNVGNLAVADMQFSIKFEGNFDLCVGAFNQGFIVVSDWDTAEFTFVGKTTAFRFFDVGPFVGHAAIDAYSPEFVNPELFTGTAVRVTGPMSEFYTDLDITDLPGTGYDLEVGGQIFYNGQIVTQATNSFAVADLPSAADVGIGSRLFVNNSNALTLTAGLGAIVAGGGSGKYPVYSDGTNWRIG